MRLQTHLNEFREVAWDNSVKELNKAIQSQCKPYLKLIGNNIPLYRGMLPKAKAGLMRTRPSRESRGTNRDIFVSLNDWLQKNGHLRRDKNVVMASSDKDRVEFFGDASYIFPVGDIKYSWIESRDINEPYRTSWQGMDMMDDYFDDYGAKGWDGEDNIEDKGWGLKKPFAKFFNTNKGFKIAYSNGYEIWIQCKEYYFAKVSDYYWTKGTIWQLASW